MIFFHEQNHQTYISSTRRFQPVELFQPVPALKLTRQFLPKPKVQMPFLVVATNQKPDHTDSNTQQQTGILQITSGRSLIYNKEVQHQKWP